MARHTRRYRFDREQVVSRRRMKYDECMDELVFEVTQENDGGLVAECLTESIFTQADSWEDLRQNVKEAVRAYYFDQAQRPSAIRLHLVRDEVLTPR